MIFPAPAKLGAHDGLRPTPPLPVHHYAFTRLIPVVLYAAPIPVVTPAAHNADRCPGERLL